MHRSMADAQYLFNGRMGGVLGRIWSGFFVVVIRNGQDSVMCPRHMDPRRHHLLVV